MSDNKHITSFEQLFPICKVIRVGNSMYVYDWKSSLLAKTDEAQLDGIRKSRAINAPPPPELEGILSNGCFLPGPLKTITPDDAGAKRMSETEVDEYFPRKLTLEITEECTLRCKYCFYTNDDPTKRKHTHAKMDESTAFRAIDYYFDRYTQALEKVVPANRRKAIEAIPPHLSWWGGEPFTHFALMKKTQRYFESKDWGKYGVERSDLTYGLTTNLTILNEEIIDFLIENNIHLSVSLDGGKAQHDANRVFKDGTGSFDTVFRNIQILIDKHPDYCKKRIMLQPVLADNIDAQAALSFIDANFELKQPSKKILSSLSSGQRHEGKFLSKIELLTEPLDFYLDQFRQRLRQLSNEPDIESILKYDKVQHREFHNIFLLESRLSLDNPNGTDFYVRTYSCPMAVDTIFVSRNGNIHCCSKVDQTYPLGDVYTGVNKKAIHELYFTYFERIDCQCKNCWAFESCKICPVLVFSNEKPVLPQERECEQLRKRAELSLMCYVVLTEEFELLYDRIASIFHQKEYEVRFDSRPTLIKQFNYGTN